MTASLHARDISLALGARHILTGVDLAVDPGQRIGLVGPNGVGKSTCCASSPASCSPTPAG
jgi:ATPase subunit of ABC transporter with duplicated ATPase domains